MKAPSVRESLARTGIDLAQLLSEPSSVWHRAGERNRAHEKDFVFAVLATTTLFLGCIPASAYTANSNGKISTNGSAADVQAAINAASAGSTILIPAGKFSWSSPVTVSTDVALQGAGLSKTTVACSGNNGLLVISNPTPFACTLSGFAFRGDAASGNTQIGILIYTPALLHDCSFVSNGGLLEMIRFAVNGGVIWNWTFYDNDQNEEAINFKNASGGANGISPDWTSDDTMGMVDSNGTTNTYVEDCTFNEMALQALDFDDNSRVVIRHCTFNNSGFSSHGLDSSPYGMRQWEVYDNTFIFSTSGRSMGGNPFPLNINWWFYCRGGTGVIFNNVMPDISSEQWGNKGSIVFTVFNIRRTSAYIGCQTTWQALHQVGQGYKGGLVLDPVYVWGNTGGTNYNTLNCNDWQPDQCGDGLTSSEFIKQNRDVYLETAKPGYTPYTYPHPLRNGGSPPFAAWENTLYQQMQSIGVRQSRIDKIKTWMQSNPPAAPYSTWENKLYSQMQSIRVWPQHLTEIKTWVNSNPPAP